MSERAKAFPSPLRGGVAPSHPHPNPPASAQASAGEPPHASAVAQRAKAEGGREEPSVPRYQLEDQIGFILRRAHQRATGTFNSVMEVFSVTPTQFAALAKLHDLGSVSQNELGRLTAMDPATIWGVVSRLIKRGYISQSVDAKDARLVILELTTKGHAATTGMKDAAAEVSRRTLEPLSVEEETLLLGLLRRLG